MPFGCPGGDAQVQGMLQVFLYIVEFGMEPQEAIEAPRAITHSFPNSFWPHGIQPGEVTVEARVDPQVREVLRNRGHIVHDSQDWGSVSCVCAITGRSRYRCPCRWSGSKINILRNRMVGDVKYVKSENRLLSSAVASPG